MKRIYLNQGKFTLVDDDIYKVVSHLKWTYASGYVVRDIHHTHLKNGIYAFRKRILLHRVIVAAPDGFEVDHADGNRLNNTRKNLRVCTHQQNSMNRGPRPGSSSQYKGVYWCNTYRTWIAVIGYNGGKKQLGKFNDEAEAARAYDKAAFDLFGEFAYLNFPLGI